MHLTRSILALVALAVSTVQAAPGPTTTLTKRWCGYHNMNTAASVTSILRPDACHSLMIAHNSGTGLSSALGVGRALHSALISIAPRPRSFR
ncbi:hypothetical protein B0H14DRAFT_3458320 [Mycena olivaceomarginata]|nr:hypothetical protein B0H14DRAFT_3458320 [Mycena olivaceomarginata]